jgi:dipeptidyl aminopeptidase/acylaminoacyl peptidase
VKTLKENVSPTGQQIEDQIMPLNIFQSALSLIKNNIGHWGWSFGGFMSSLAIEKVLMYLLLPLL